MQTLLWSKFSELDAWLFMGKGMLKSHTPVSMPETGICLLRKTRWGNRTLGLVWAVLTKLICQMDSKNWRHAFEGIPSVSLFQAFPQTVAVCTLFACFQISAVSDFFLPLCMRGGSAYKMHLLHVAQLSRGVQTSQNPCLPSRFGLPSAWSQVQVIWVNLPWLLTCLQTYRWKLVSVVVSSQYWWVL